MGKLSTIISAATVLPDLYRPKGKGLVTFKGWNGRWWTKIDYGKGVWDAATFVMPLKWSLVVWGLEAVTASRKKRR